MAEDQAAEETVAPDQAAEDTNVVDHRSPAAEVDDGLRYPFEGTPEAGSVIEVAKGVFWARIPLPWSLDHINVYLFDEGDGWTIVDTGSNGSRGIEAWEAIEASVFGGKPVTRVIATHLHPDHLGLAGWLVERHKASFAMTMTEYLMASHLWAGAAQEFPEHELEYLFSMGVDRQYEPMIRSAGFGNYKRGVHSIPPVFTRLEDGSEIDLGNRRWRVIMGRGHSPEHACLLCLDEPLFISGDQVLPRITSNVSVYAREPMANPLAHWIASLDRLKQIGGDPLVLPAHGQVFYGLHARLDALIDGHLRKLRSLHGRIAEKPRSPVQTFPALFRRKITGFDFFLALGEAVSHINLLESVGLASRSFDDGVYRFEAQGTYDETDVMASVMALKGVPLRSLADFE
ncbi:MAG: MBL fold metallo-hydrolase [Alphaproteobacteria bacterium]|nr:MAG: MBL fold metallo-hydrolase [Alphaproteobacteria bacterium]